MNAIVNYATPDYSNGAMRLKKSIEKYDPQAAVLQWSNNEKIHPECPPHHINPYAFKVYAMEQGKKYFDNVFWMDSSCYLIKPITTIWDIIENEGYFMQECGHLVGRWCNDTTLSYFGLTREQANEIPMFTAGCFGLNFRSEIAKEFFSQWQQAMKDGMFKGDWKDHRHDLTCGSIIAQKLGMKFKSESEFLDYASPDQHVNDTIVIKLQGIN